MCPSYDHALFFTVSLLPLDSLNAGLSLPVLQKHDCRKDCKLKSKMKRKKQLILSNGDLTLSLSSRSVSNRLLSFLRSRNCLRTRKSVKITKARFREASKQKRVLCETIKMKTSLLCIKIHNSLTLQRKIRKDKDV